ncbi:hypothetical protein D3C73_1026900 [compost metagenome]
MFMNQHLFSVGRQVGKLRHGLLHVGQAWLVALAAAGFRRYAQRQVTSDAMGAMAAVDRQARDHMIPWFDGADVRAHLFDDTGCLVAEHHGGRMRIHPVHNMQIRMADTHSDSAHQHFTRTRFADPDFLDGQRGTRRMEYGSFHDLPRKNYCFICVSGQAVHAVTEQTQQRFTNFDRSALPRTLRTPRQWPLAPAPWPKAHHYRTRHARTKGDA